MPLPARADADVLARFHVLAALRVRNISQACEIFWNYSRPPTEYRWKASKKPVPLKRSTTESDEHLIRRIAAGHAEALIELFRLRRGDVYRFALHMSGSSATAEDVTQEVFVTVIREARRFDQTRGAGLSWLLGITRNLVRRRIVRDRLLAPLDDVPDGEFATRADPAVELERAQQIASVRRAVMALPLRYREVVLLCDLQELSYQDAAIALRCAVGTVRSRLHRGRALLALKLRKDADGRKPAIALA